MTVRNDVRGVDDCPACRHAHDHGFWGDAVPAGWTHDRDSHVTFPATQVWGSCSGCGTVFRGEQAFDLHHSSKNCPPPEDGFRCAGKSYTAHTHDSGFTFYAEDQAQRGVRLARELGGGAAEAAEPEGPGESL